MRVETACDPHAVARGTRALVEIALQNVSRNAARETRRGAVRLSCARLPNNRVVVEVADDGPGIGPQARERLFERFSGTGGEGFGIGLPLTREIVRLLGGDVEIDSAATGTTVRLVLRAA